MRHAVYFFISSCCKQASTEARGLFTEGVRRRGECAQVRGEGGVLGLPVLPAELYALPAGADRVRTGHARPRRGRQRHRRLTRHVQWVLFSHHQPVYSRTLQCSRIRYESDRHSIGHLPENSVCCLNKLILSQE